MRDPFVDKIRVALERAGSLRAGASLLAAVSGGADSVALLAALAALRNSEWRLGAAHVNHKLRGRESEADARFVARVAKGLSVPVYLAEARIAPGANLEERAREQRYGRLVEIARSEKFHFLATAHTIDDQAETVLLRLLRGAGTGGLSGIAPERPDGILRPMLTCTRDEVLEFLRRRGLRFRRDRTNRSILFTRNRIRRFLLPRLAREFNPAIRETLARTAELLRDDEAFLEETARRAARRFCRDSRLNGRNFDRLAPALQRRVIRVWLSSRRGHLRSISAAHVEHVRALAAGKTGGARISLPGGKVSRSGGFLVWEEPLRLGRSYRRKLTPSRATEVAGWNIFCRCEESVRRRPIPGRWRAVFDEKALGKLHLEVRPPAAGDRLRPLGLGGSKKLQDVFVDAKVPREDRADWPIIHQGETILWIPGLVRSEVAPVTRLTRRVVVFEARFRASINVAARYPMCYGFCGGSSTGDG